MSYSGSTPVSPPSMHKTIPFAAYLRYLMCRPQKKHLLPTYVRQGKVRYSTQNHFKAAKKPKP